MREDKFGNIIECKNDFGVCATCFEQYRCVVYRKRCLNAIYGKDMNITEVKQNDVYVMQKKRSN